MIFKNLVFFALCLVAFPAYSQISPGNGTGTVTNIVAGTGLTGGTITTTGTIASSATNT
jgi:hypothetical protein